MECFYFLLLHSYRCYSFISLLGINSRFNHYKSVESLSPLLSVKSSHCYSDGGGGDELQASYSSYTITDQPSAAQPLGLQG
jgi:hypothetical protein